MPLIALRNSGRVNWVNSYTNSHSATTFPLMLRKEDFTVSRGKDIRTAEERARLVLRMKVKKNV